MSWSPKASERLENVPIAPNVRSPLTRGRDEHRLDRQVADEAVGVREVDERGIGRVVAGDDDFAAGDGLAEHPDAGVDPERADPGPTAVVGDPGVGGEAEDPGGLVEEVGHRAVGPEEAGGLLDGPVEDRGRVGLEGRPPREPTAGSAFDGLGFRVAAGGRPFRGAVFVGARFAPRACPGPLGGLASTQPASRPSSWLPGGRRCGRRFGWWHSGCRSPSGRSSPPARQRRATRRRRPARRAGRRPA